MQILHNGHDHWLLASAIGYKRGHVSVYVSLYSNCTGCVKESLARLTKHPGPNIVLKFEDVHKPSESSDFLKSTLGWLGILVLKKLDRGTKIFTEKLGILVLP